MSADLFPMLEELDRRARALAETTSPGEVFKLLLDTARLTAPRSAVFLVRKGRLYGWGAVGHAPDVSKRLRSYEADLDQGWVGSLIGSPDQPFACRQHPVRDPDFGQPIAAESAGIVVRVKGKPIAFVLLERSEGQAPWYPQAVAVLVTIAQLKLDLDLATRKLNETTSPAVAPIAPEAPAATAATAATVATAAPTESAPIVPAVPVAVAPADNTPAQPVAEAAVDIAVEEDAVEEDGQPVPEDAQAKPDKQVEAARRFARLVATDIRLYNEEAVVLGRKNGDLVERLEEHLVRGKETFLRRHGDLGSSGLEILHEAFVNVLGGGDPQLVPNHVLD